MARAVSLLEWGRGEAVPHVRRRSTAPPHVVHERAEKKNVNNKREKNTHKRQQYLMCKVPYNEEANKKKQRQKESVLVREGVRERGEGGEKKKQN